jgi:hypothetical protein
MGNGRDMGIRRHGYVLFAESGRKYSLPQSMKE